MFQEIMFKNLKRGIDNYDVRRLKGLGATVLELLGVYEKKVRSVLELVVPV